MPSRWCMVSSCMFVFVLYQGNKTDRMSKLISDLSDVQPIYKTFDGWNEPITDIDSYNGLPKKNTTFFIENIRIIISVFYIYHPSCIYLIIKYENL